MRERLDRRRRTFELLRAHDRILATMATAAAAKDDQPAHHFAKDQLKAFVERVERLEEEKKALSDDIRDVYAEAKGNGFDVKTLRVVVRLRKQDVNERKEHEAMRRPTCTRWECCRTFPGSAAQHAVLRCRPGIFAYGVCETIPDLRRTAPRCTASGKRYLVCRTRITAATPYGSPSRN